MAYSDFTLETVLGKFQLKVDDRVDLFAAVADHPISPLLKMILDEGIPLALAVHTEKARSELIVVPILLEIRRLMGGQIGFFSGVSFDVAPDRGLDGVCDFILSQGPIQLILGPPVLTIVEAKNDNIKSGLGQCVAEMLAARIFNERAGVGPTAIFGAVTTGSLWRFLRLTGETVEIDRSDYYLDQLGKIIGNLLRCVGKPEVG